MSFFKFGAVPFWLKLEDLRGTFGNTRGGRSKLAQGSACIYLVVKK
jgi:hypothetical protein